MRKGVGWLLCILHRSLHLAKKLRYISISYAFGHKKVSSTRKIILLEVLVYTLGDPTV